MIRKTCLLILVLVTTLGLSALPAYAISQWETFISGSQVPISFTEIFDAPDGTQYTAYYPLSVSGCWDEAWQGTLGGEAYLGSLYLGGEVDSNPDSVDLTITPDATYAGTDTYNISTVEAWTLHSSNAQYMEGYTDPWVQYNTASVSAEGHVDFYNSDFDPINQDIYYTWNTHPKTASSSSALSASANTSYAAFGASTLTPVGQAVFSPTPPQLYPTTKPINASYPNIVAKIYSEKITGAQLASQVAIAKRSWESAGKAKPDSQYQKMALQQLVKRALIDHEAEVKGITTSQLEARTAVAQSVRDLLSLPDNNAFKTQFLDGIKKMGYSSPTQYENDPIIIGFYQEHLTNAKVRGSVEKRVPAPTNEEIEAYLGKNGIDYSTLSKGIQRKIKLSIYQRKQAAAWKNYTDKLMNSDGYQLFVNIDIRGGN